MAAALLRLQRLRACSARATANLLGEALKASSGQMRRATTGSGAVSKASGTPDGSGTVFNTAGEQALAADPGVPAPDAEAAAAPRGDPAAATFEPAAGVSPAAVAAAQAAAAEEAQAAAADAAVAGAAAERKHAGAAGAEAAAEADAAADSWANELSDEQREVLSTIVREALAAEAAAEQLVRAQRAVMGRSRPDLAAAADDQKAAAEAIKTLAPGLRSRPSLLGPLWGAAGAAAGAVAGVAPRNFADAIRSGAAEALTERYTAHLRRLSSAGLAGSPAAESLRKALRTLRDVSRAPDGAKPVPDLVSFAMNQQLPKDMTAAEGVGGLTKLAFQGMFSVASHL